MRLSPRLLVLVLAALAAPLTGTASAQVVSTPVPTESGLVAVPGFPATGLPGQATNDDFGTSVASAGDVNGDGFADIIVGAAGHDALGSNTGRAYVYFGGPSASTTPDLMLTGEAAGDFFGRSVSGAGDVNGDGFDDVLVGADFNDAGGANAGRAYVFFGGLSPSTTADLVLTGEATADEFGSSVSGAGDVNGDGFADVIVGARDNDAGGADAGRAYVFFGGASPDATADLTLTGEAAGDLFGRSVSGAGDVNGDGFADVLVGAELNDAGGTSAGRAYVFFGGASPDATADLTLTGVAVADGFGRSVSGAGDVNGDGFADIIVGAYGNDAGGAGAGQAYVFFGGASPDATADLTFTGEASADFFGRAVSGVDDVNGDSYADVIVGADLNDAGGTNAGRAYVFFGGPTADATPDITMTGTGAGDSFGASVSGTGDVDGDGLADLLVGAINADTPAGTSTGAAYVYSNANTGDGIAQWAAAGVANSDGFGSAVADAGDVNGDGYSDLLVGARASDGGGSQSGGAYLFHGGPAADAVPDLTFIGESVNSFMGTSVSGAGDVNGDGYDDLLVGAPGGIGGGEENRAYVFFGGPSADAVPDLTFNGEADFDELGRSVSGAGDINGDGYADVIVGAPLNDSDGSGAGRAYVYFGGPSPDAVADLTFSRSTAGERFGSSVSGAGDVNGDGYDDFVVGAILNDTGGSNAGQVYLYYGGPSANTTPDLIITGTAGEQLGNTVSGIGDVNGDGYDDFLVGASYGTLGRVYLYFGGPGMDDIPDVVFEGGDSSSDEFGESISGGGDVNGDGYADIAIGIPGFDAARSNAGQAHVYFGGPSLDAIPDFIVTGPDYGGTFGAGLGSGVALVRDTDGDGRADLLAGGQFGGPNDGGGAYLYRATGPASAPGLYRLADVPGDQGGVLHARWTRSDQETQGTVSTYLVQRSEPAGTSGYAWETIATVPGSMEPHYSLAVPTYSDQTGSNPGTTCVRVTAQGDNGELWRSMVSCAASIDNLAPAAPPSLALAASPDGDVALAWDEVTGEPDLFGYDVFRSADASCDASDPLAGSASATDFEDDATDFGTDAWYCVASRDVHGNRSPVTDAASANPAVLAAVKVVLEGAYQSGLSGGALMRTDLEDVLPLAHPFAGAPWHHTGTEAINPRDTSPANGRPDVFDQHEVVDWVLIGLRSDATEVDEARAAALLLSDGTLLNPSTAAPYASVKPAAPGAYHVVVYHRSHLAAMSVFTIGLDGDGPNPAFDFSLSPSLVYGAGVKGLNRGIYALFAGDGDGDGSVLAPDEQAVWGPAVGLAGYLGGDFNLDGSVLADDQQVLWVPNVGAQSEVPGAASLVPPAETRRQPSGTAVGQR